MPKNETTMIDIYEAMGGEVNEDRTMVSMSKPGQYQPFKIELLVYASGYEMGADGERVNLQVLLHDSVVFDRTAWGQHVVRHIEHIEQLTLPVDQVNIIKDRVDEADPVFIVTRDKVRNAIESVQKRHDMNAPLNHVNTVEWIEAVMEAIR